jgi:hypothetical protein
MQLETNVVGTFETCQPRERAEVIGACLKRRDWSQSEVAQDSVVPNFGWSALSLGAFSLRPTLARLHRNS